MEETALKDYVSENGLITYRDQIIAYVGKELDKVKLTFNEAIQNQQNQITDHIKKAGAAQFEVDEDGNLVSIPTTFSINENRELVYEENLFDFYVDDHGDLYWEVN